MLILIDAPHFCAAYSLRTGDIAPIIKYMKGWSLAQIVEYCNKKGWEIACID